MASDRDQALSNTVAGGVSAPVDAISWLLRKIGLPIPKKPVGGSDWMEQHGLTRPVDQGAGQVVGETVGNLLPGPNVLPSAKAMLLLPAMLRKEKPAVQALNQAMIPMHSTDIANYGHNPRAQYLKKPSWQISSPSFSLFDRDSAYRYAHDWADPNNAEEVEALYRNMMLVGKPGSLDTTGRIGHIFDSDAGTTVLTGKNSLAEQLKTRKEDIANFNRFGGEDYPTPNWESFLEMLRDPKVQSSVKHAKELKHYNQLPVTSDNFSGAILSPMYDSDGKLKAAINALRSRGITPLLGDVEHSNELWDKANWLQQQSLK